MLEAEFWIEAFSRLDKKKTLHFLVQMSNLARFLYARPKTGRIMVWRRLSVRPSVGPSVGPSVNKTYRNHFIF